MLAVQERDAKIEGLHRDLAFSRARNDKAELRASEPVQLQRRIRALEGAWRCARPSVYAAPAWLRGAGGVEFHQVDHQWVLATFVQLGNAHHHKADALLGVRELHRCKESLALQARCSRRTKLTRPPSARSRYKGGLRAASPAAQRC